MSAHKFVPSSLDVTTCSCCGLDVNDAAHKGPVGASAGRGDISRDIPMTFNLRIHTFVMLTRIERYLATGNPQPAHKLVLELLEQHSLRS